MGPVYSDLIYMHTRKGYFNYSMSTNRLQQLSEAHTWLSDVDIQLLLTHKYLKFSKTFIIPNVQHMLDNYTFIACRLPEHDLRNQPCQVKEFCS